MVSGNLRTRQLGRAMMALALALTATGVAAAAYKWVDEKGGVHYSDKVPPDVVNRSSVVINREGVQTRRIDAVLTPEQVRAQEADAERRQAQAKQQEDVLRRDRALLGSYSTEGEIDLARNRALGVIDAVIKSSTSYREQLLKRKNDLDTKIAAFQGKPMPPVYERDSENLKQELARQAELVELKRKEKESVAARYDADKLRWRELMAAKAKGGPAGAGSASAASAAATNAASPAEGSASPAGATARR